MRKLVFFLIPALFSISTKTYACSVCFGDPNSMQSKALTGAVFFLLVLTVVVLTAIAALLIRWTLRARRLEKTSSIS